MNRDSSLTLRMTRKKQKVLNLYKPIGVTPLGLIEKFKEKYPEYKSQKLGYAGRLDPMAEGVLLVLVGEENKKRKEYERLKKEYEFDVLLGIKTDSYDVLGKIVFSCHPEGAKRPKDLDSSLCSASLGFVQNDIKKMIGKHLQSYPPYSSPRVNGKPLFWWARENRLSEIEIPKKEIEIYDFKIIKTYELKAKKLEEIIIDKISKVKGAFRQKEIIESWKRFFKGSSPCHPELVPPWNGKSPWGNSGSRSRNKFGMTNNEIQDNIDAFKIFKFHISCSSGTYVRSIANELGGMAINIKRVKVGKYTVEDSMKV